MTDEVKTKVMRIGDISSLPTREKFDINDTVMVLGWNRRGDGGGSVYFWDRGALDAADGFHVIESTVRTDIGRWKRLALGTNNDITSVDTLADLRNANGAQIAIADLAGYSSAGDGGEGTFDWDPTITAADDDGGIVVFASGVTGNGGWVRRFIGPINVKWFGAIGDGVTNDNTAIQAAIAYAGDNAGTSVYAPSGTYAFTEEIVVPTDTVVYGDGRDETEFLITSTARGFHILDEANTEIRDLSINMNKGVVADSGANQQAIYIESTGDELSCRISNIRAYNGHHNGIHIFCDATTEAVISIFDSTVDTFDDVGVYVSQSISTTIYTTLRSVISRDNESHGFFIANALNTSIIDCSALDNGQDAVAGGSGIVAFGTITGDPTDVMKDFVISDCICKGNGNAAAGANQGYGIQITHRTQYFTIQGNVCIDNYGTAIILDETEVGGSSDLFDVYGSVSNNVCRGSISGNGIYLNHCSLTTVSGNITEDNSSSGISIAGSNNSIVGNSSSNNTSTGVGLFQDAGAVYGNNKVVGNSYDSNGVIDFISVQSSPNMVVEGSLQDNDLVSRITDLYNFSVDGGGISDIEIAYLPDNAYILRAWYEVVSAFTSGGAATVAFGVDVNDPTGLKTATAFNHADYAVGLHDFTPDGTAANATTKTTAMRAIIMTIAGATLLSGKVRIWCEYAVGE